MSVEVVAWWRGKRFPHYDRMIDGRKTAFI